MAGHDKEARWSRPDFLVLGQREPDYLCAGLSRALTDERHLFHKLVLTRRLRNLLVRVPESRVVARDPLFSRLHAAVDSPPTPGKNLRAERHGPASPPHESPPSCSVSRATSSPFAPRGCRQPMVGLVVVVPWCERLEPHTARSALFSEWLCKARKILDHRGHASTTATATNPTFIRISSDPKRTYSLCRSSPFREDDGVSRRTFCLCAMAAVAVASAALADQGRAGT